MTNPPVVGYRFRPTDVEIIEDYLRPKNDLASDTSHVDGVMSTVNISNFDPSELRYQSIMKSEDQVWYFFGSKEKKYKKGDRQIRKTKSGFWKRTGKPVIIKRKNGEKIGEKWVLVFHLSKILKTKWVMHEYHATPTPNQMMMTYTVCKLKFKGEASEISSPSCGEIEHNNSGGLSTGYEVGTLFECPQSQELENPRQLSGFLHVFEDARLEDDMRKAINNLYEQRNVISMQEDRNDYRPKKPLTGVFVGHSSDDSDSDSISAVTVRKFFTMYLDHPLFSDST